MLESRQLPGGGFYVDWNKTTGRAQGAERRRHPRLAIDWPVTIALSDGRYEARLRDISKAGVCFYLDRRIPEMTILKLRLDLPGADGLKVALEGGGVVVRCQALSPHLDHYEVAVFLNELSDTNREKLETFLAGAS